MKLIATTAATFTFASILFVSGQLAKPVRAQASAPAKGEILFKQRCAMCHAVAGTGGKVGPDLAKLLGRKAGGTAYAYSPAMKGSKIVWNAKTLDTYLAAPPKAVPGTKMMISLSKPEDRAAVIAYLTAQK